MKRKFLSLLIALSLLLSLLTAWAEVLVADGVALSDDDLVEYDCDYSTPGEVSLYLYAFQELPPNFITKREARALGWISSEGNLWDVAWGLSIGGDVFGNREGLLPEARERTWYECDVNYFGGFRGSERVLYASDGLIYYTGDHYATFELLYDGWYEEEEP